MIETKVAAGSFTGIAAGLLTWALVAYVPAFKTGLPPQLAAFIPVIAGWLVSTVAGYLAPHTPRAVPPIPGITPPAPPGGNVTVTPPPPARLTP